MKILCLYNDLMNLYGESGNIKAINPSRPVTRKRVVGSNRCDNKIDGSDIKNETAISRNDTTTEKTSYYNLAGHSISHPHHSISPSIIKRVTSETALERMVIVF